MENLCEIKSRKAKDSLFCTPSFLEQKKKRGVILIFVLWSVFILLFMVMGILFYMRLNQNALKKFQDSFVLKQIAKNGILLGAARLRDKEYDHFFGVTTVSVVYENYDFINTVSIHDEGSLFNVNFVPIALLKKVPEISSKILKKIEDSQKSSQFLLHLSSLDPYFFDQKWSRFVTVYGSYLEGLSTKSVQQKFKSFVRQKPYLERNILRKIALQMDHRFNINTVPKELLSVLLNHIGFASKEKNFLLNFVKHNVFLNKDDLQTKTKNYLSLESQKSLENYFSTESYFFKIRSVVERNKGEKGLVKFIFEAIVRRMKREGFKSNVVILQVNPVYR